MAWTEGEGSVGGGFWITILRGLLRVIEQRDLVMFLLWVSFCFRVTVEGSPRVALA